MRPYERLKLRAGINTGPVIAGVQVLIASVCEAEADGRIFFHFFLVIFLVKRKKLVECGAHKFNNAQRMPQSDFLLTCSFLVLVTGNKKNQKGYY